jgi:hypothetical protein
MSAASRATQEQVQSGGGDPYDLGLQAAMDHAVFMRGSKAYA